MKYAKNWLMPVAGAVLVAGMMGCSTVTVSTDFDPAADFSGYKTFTIAPLTQFNQIVAGRVQAALTQALQGRGLQPAASGGDLTVGVAAKIGKQTQITSTDYGYGYGYGWRGGGGMSTATVREVPVGTLVVDLVDAKAKKLVWRGIASDTMDTEATGEKRQANLNAALVQLFASYPPGAKK
jgi:hypothetical protein